MKRIKTNIQAIIGVIAIILMLTGIIEFNPLVILLFFTVTKPS